MGIGDAEPGFWHVGRAVNSPGHAPAERQAIQALKELGHSTLAETQAQCHREPRRLRRHLRRTQCRRAIPLGDRGDCFTPAGFAMTNAKARLKEQLALDIIARVPL